MVPHNGMGINSLNAGIRNVIGINVADKSVCGDPLQALLGIWHRLLFVLRDHLTGGPLVRYWSTSSLE